MASVAVVVDGEPLLFDCGAGATYRMMEAGLDPLGINYIFITHHHSDHILDLGQVVLTNWMMGGARPLRVVGPRRTAHIVDLLFSESGVYGEDIRSRIESNGQYLNRQRLGRDLEWPVVEASDLSGDLAEACRGEGWVVTATSTPHLQPHIQSIAYRVDTPSGAVVLTGDTGPAEEIVELAKGAQILVHDCSHLDDVLEASAMMSTHTGPLKAAEIAEAAGVSTLVLFHFGAELDRQDLLERAHREASAAFSGTVIVSADLDRITVE
jgi:ribonuclease BN (tRNA processing enzyme)